LKPPQTESDRLPQSGAASNWLRFLLPSVADLLFIAALLGLSSGALGRLLLRDAGTGWHIRNGQLMLLTHSITRVDPFSATMSGQPWYAWEWLYDVLIAAIHNALGLNGVVFSTAAIIAATFILVFHLAIRRGGSLPVTFFLLALMMGTSAIHFLARPHVVSWLLAVIWFELLDSAQAMPDRRIFFLPAVMLLWVNVHGGFLLGFALLGIYIVAAGIEYFIHPEQRAETRAWLSRLALVTGLCLLMSLCNPFGYRLHLHIYRYLTDRFLMDRVSEFLTPNFHGAAQQCFAVLLLMTIIALASTRRRPDPARLLVLLFAAYSGLYASRNLPVSSMLLTMIVAPQLSEAVATVGSTAGTASVARKLFGRLHGFGARMEKLETNLQGHAWLALSFAVGLWACTHGGRLGPTQLINAFFDDKRFPVAAAQVLADRDVREPIFCPDQWGGYLIYRLYPQTKVLVDDRHDLYGDQFFKRYLDVVFVQPDWRKVLDEEQVDWIVVQKDSSLGTILRESRPWGVVHEDETAVLFHREP
jgi:hypothetical protein